MLCTVHSDRSVASARLLHITELDEAGVRRAGT
jgi:hypothetical protein